MQKQTWSIILLLLTLILLSLFFGKKSIYEGAEPGVIFAPSAGSSNYKSVKDDYDSTSILYDKISKEATSLEQKNQNLIKEKEASDKIIANLQNQISSKQIDKDSLYQKVIQNSYVSAVVNLPLRTDAINTASDLGISDESNTKKQMNFDIDGKPTHINYTTIDGKQCASFKFDQNNQSDSTNSLYQYISFPFVNPKQFSFCIWIYIIPNDIHYYTVLSITNKNKLTPSVQLDVHGSKIMIYCALPNAQQPLHSARKSTPGWVFIAYTYDSNGNSSMYGLDETNLNTGGLMSSFPSNGIFQSDNIRYRPNCIFIGRSGDHIRGFNGYVHDFNYYAFVLPPKDVLEMYNYTK